MNAYELADKMEKLAGHFHNEAINMLRQQADRIAELERLVSDMIYEKASGVYQGKYLEQYWVKQQSAEPVAWTNQKWLNVIAKEPQLFQPLFAHGKQTEHNTIPLYTTPQIKELSDREILEIAYLPELCDDDGNIRSCIEFAKAILKKASER